MASKVMHIEWSQGFNTGITKFDEQHKIILAKVIAFIDTVNAGDSENTQILFYDLIDYIYQHFDAEEDAMVKHDYPEYNDHKKDHDVCRDTIERTKAKYIKFKKLDVLTLNILESWLSSHVLEKDKAYSGFFKDKAI